MSTSEIHFDANDIAGIPKEIKSRTTIGISNNSAT